MSWKIRLGEQIRIARESREVQQNELAHLIGVTPAALSKIEKGRGAPSILVLINISRVLKVSLDDLVRDV
jgi:transcriptional regulator with XRE-family HTH domain